MSDDKFRQVIAPLQEFAQTMLEVGDLRTGLDPRIKPEWIVERDGKPTLPYEFLLKIAHAEGLKRIRTNVLQFPNKDNEYSAVVQASVSLYGEPMNKEFDGTACADRMNTGGKFSMFLVATAETRAKGRALRDALGITMLCFEEMGEESRPDRTGTEKHAYSTEPQSPTPISGWQAAKLRQEYAARGLGEPDDLDEWTSDRAMEVLGELRSGTVAEVKE